MSHYVESNDRRVGMMDVPAEIRVKIFRMIPGRHGKSQYMRVAKALRKEVLTSYDGALTLMPRRTEAGDAPVPTETLAETQRITKITIRIQHRHRDNVALLDKLADTRRVEHLCILAESSVWSSFNAELTAALLSNPVRELRLHFGEINASYDVSALRQIHRLRDLRAVGIACYEFPGNFTGLDFLQPLASLTSLTVLQTLGLRRNRRVAAFPFANWHLDASRLTNLVSVTVTAPRATFVEAISGLSSLRFLAVELYSSSVYAIYDTVHHEPVLLNGAFPALEDLTLRTSTPAACLAYFGCPPNLRRIRLEIVHPHATEPIEPFGQAVRTMAPSDLELCFRGASLRRDEENALISSCLGANLGLEGIHIHRHACDGLKVPELSKMPRLCRLTLSWTPADLRDALSALDKLAFLELPADGDAVAALSHVVPPEGVTVEVVANAMDQHLRHLLCLGFAARRASRREGTVRLVIVAPGGRPMDDMPKLTMGESFGEAGAAQP